MRVVLLRPELFFIWGENAAVQNYSPVDQIHDRLSVQNTFYGLCEVWYQCVSHGGSLL